MENSNSDLEVAEVPELTVELELDQENLVKLLQTLTENGVNFRLKKVVDKADPQPMITVTTVPAVTWPMGIYQDAPPLTYPHTTPGTATPAGVPLPTIITICGPRAGGGFPLGSTSTAFGYPPGTSFSYTRNEN